MTVSKVLLFSGTINEICTYLEGYEKTRALKMRERASSEKNPIIALMDKQELELLMQCNEEWFSDTSNCMDEHLARFSF